MGLATPGALQVKPQPRVQPKELLFCSPRRRQLEEPAQSWSELAASAARREEG